MRTQEDFARVAYEALADGRRAGNLSHVELMFNPQYFYGSGVSYRAMVDGLIEGIEANLGRRPKEGSADSGYLSLIRELYR